ncbi:restriction endonuclease, SacI family [Paenibacillus kribbensis]|uniref:restriction endonuclease, SacI family n=1 Tax=Paenibacillus kribbensis TaxID=172713 RepID=UPI0012FD4B7B|nr:restriction endonuclease, SacI family [Paenibacillus kribbensis]
MSEVRVDKNQATEVLVKAIERATTKGYSWQSPFSKNIQTVLFGTHLTFRYILVTALLAKATNPKVNALCLQAGSQLDGAYDARSLCHNLLVPFERKYFNGGLGSSNEPFLNKPARAPELNPSNPVRRGNDQMLLDLLCTFLPQIQTQQEAFDALTDAIACCFIKFLEIRKSSTVQAAKIPTLTEMDLFLNDLLEQACGGETLVLTVGVLVKLHTMALAGKTKVEVHVVNQSGASSKEVSDIDVYLNNKMLYAFEAKDKLYKQEDVAHAVRKVIDSGFNRLIFVSGPRAMLQEASKQELIDAAALKGVYLTFMSHKKFIKFYLSQIPPTSIELFFSTLMELTREARMKDDTITYLQNTARKHGFIE